MTAKLLLIPSYLWTVFLCVSFHLQLPGQEVYTVETQYPVHPLTAHLQVLPDPDNSMQWQDVLNLPDDTFKPREAFGRRLDVHTAYWGRLQLRATKPLQGWVLHIEDQWPNNIAWIRGIGKAEILIFQDGRLIERHLTGADVPRSEKTIKDNWVKGRVPLELEAGNTYTMLVRVEGNSFGTFPYFNLSLRRPDHQGYYEPSHGVDSFLWFVFGVAFIAFIYHLLLWGYTREKIFGWFSLWLFFCAFSQGMTVGLDTEYLIGEIPWIRVPLWLLIPNSMLFTFWFFGRSFINSKEKFPVLDKFLVALPSLMIFELIATILYVLLGDPMIESTRVGYHYHFITLFSLMGFALAITIALQKDLFARYFGVGAVIATGFVTLGGLWSLGWLNPGFDPYTTGMLFQIVAYSVGIAYRQQQTKKKAAEEHIAYERSKAEVQRIRDLDEVKSRFFANISHEFRTPLTLIKGPLETLRKGENISSQSKTVDLIYRNAQRLETLVDQLLDLSKLESGEERLNPKQGGLLTFLKATVFSFESLADRQNISLQASFPKDVETAWFDKDKLEKILVNLLSNAFKYTPSGGTVRVGLQCDEKFMSIEISDTGKGITQEALRHIFDRFYRVEGTEEKGSGIGLALVKELVDLHHGQVHVSSIKGEGTSFRLRIPVSLNGLGVTSPSINQESSGMLPSPPLLQLSAQKELETLPPQNDTLPIVLVIEDNDDLLQYISGILRSSYQVLQAIDGLQGERMAIEHVPDVIVSDVMMPEKDGFALCHSLKRNPKTSHVPVILLTAKAGQHNRLEGLGQGADAYLTKPFNADELLVRVRNLIEARKKIFEQFRQQGHLIIEELDLASLDDRFLQQVMGYIREQLDNDQLSVEDIAREVGFSRSQLHRKLKALINKSASQMVSEIRLNEAKRMLEQQAGSVSEIAYSVGFSNLSYFTKSFKEKFGVLPSAVKG